MSSATASFLCRPWLLAGIGFLIVQWALALRAGVGVPDDADQFLFSQTVQAGYHEQPPLFTWIVYAFNGLLGPGPATLALVKTLLLAGLALALSCAACAARLPPPAWALAAASPLLNPIFAWHALFYLSHTLLLAVSCAVTLALVLKLADRPSRWAYVALGLSLGCGLLSKYNFVHFAGPLFLAALTLPEFRRVLLRPALLGSLSLAVILAAPHFVWLSHHLADVAAIFRLKLRHGPPSGPLAAWMRHLEALVLLHLGRSLGGAVVGVSQLFINLGLTLSPVVLLTAWLLPQSLQRTESPRSAVRLLERFFVLALLCLAGQLILGGVTRVHERWLQPVALFVPLYLLARVAEWPAGQSRRFTRGLAVLAVGLLIARGVQVNLKRPPLDLHEPAQALARAIPPGMPIIALDRVTAGRLRLQLPQSPHLCARHFLYVPATVSLPQDGCCLIWPADEGATLPQELRRFGQRLGLAVPESIEGQEVGDSFGQRWRYVVWEPPQRSLTRRMR